MLIVGGVDIGNRKDISPRMIETILDADVIVAENLEMFNSLCISLSLSPKAKLIEYYAPMHESKEVAILYKITEYLDNNKKVLIVTDDGMPGVADPGGRIIQMAHSLKHRVTVVPGPSIVSTLPAVLGLDSRRFTFEDELPSGQAERIAMLQKLKAEDRGFLFIVKNRRDENTKFYEVLDDIREVFPGETPIGVGLNLTMPNEKIILSSVDDIMRKLGDYIITQKDFISVFVQV